MYRTQTHKDRREYLLPPHYYVKTHKLSLSRENTQQRDINESTSVWLYNTPWITVDLWYVFIVLLSFGIVKIYGMFYVFVVFGWDSVCHIVAQKFIRNETNLSYNLDEVNTNTFRQSKVYSKYTANNLLIKHSELEIQNVYNLAVLVWTVNEWRWQMMIEDKITQ